ncbi:hypothetical protein [Kitasatospora griseola]|uniref:hypothetical protein n=1 Tax=Kitasatospora griseola TaxID=2064 RepID=UPI000698DA90|nr:hypothetical protein [Kitasatospora griseola]
MPEAVQADPGLDRVGRPAAYGAALVMTPYLLIKVSWVVGAIAGLLPIGDVLGLAGWVVLNTVTTGTAGTGIVMALALVRPWGTRIPGPLVAFAASVGSGLLVAMEVEPDADGRARAASASAWDPQGRRCRHACRRAGAASVCAKVPGRSGPSVRQARTAVRAPDTGAPGALPWVSLAGGGLLTVGDVLLVRARSGTD